MVITGIENKGTRFTMEEKKVLELSASITVRQLAELLRVSPVDIIKQLMKNGILATINQVIDYQTAEMVAAALGYKVRPVSRPAEVAQQAAPSPPAGLKPRPPVVVVMGHVDHGKTKLLDAIRQTNVVASEPGAITQHIGAYQVQVNGRKITFLDTPGHEAFTTMRARGARVADIAVLVVAADDGVMPQTLEAINHSRAAGLPIVVAINKIDRPNANPDLVKQQLADAGLVVEEWGGDTLSVAVSAKEKKGISDLLESILLVAEMAELKADPSRPAEGVVIEARLDKTRGPIATVLVKNGTLRPGDVIVAGTALGKTRAMFNDLGKPVKRAEPSDPAEILGLNEVHQAGDTFSVVADEQQARLLVQKRLAEKGPEAPQATRPLTLGSLFDQINAGKVKELNIILKTDVRGSIEPIKTSLEQLATEEVKVRIIHSAAGSITESDVLLAIASQGLIVGFGVGAEPGAKRLAEKEGIDIRYYNVIYDLVDDVQKALTGMLEPKFAEVIEGRGEIIATFPHGKGKKIAGVRITEGKATLGASIRVRRRGEIIRESTVGSLKHYQDFVKEVAAGNEAGVVIKDFNDFEIGDTVEFFSMRQVA
ncbi:MAG: translation initiation factor IF-2 [Chloroflexi bacterium]|nr:translation initiation factor IF-2 [Chloroflexota bacterium]